MKTNFTDEELRGVNLAVKITADSYPFIRGWQLSSGYENYDSLLTIDLIVDLVEVNKFYGGIISEFWLEKFLEGESIDTGYLRSLSSTDMSNSIREKEEIKNDLNLNYFSLPNKLKGKKIEKLTDYSFFHQFITINYFITQPTSKIFFEF